MAIVNPSLMDSFDLNGTNISEPSTAQQTDGYVTNEIPTSNNHGFMFKEFYRFLHFLKETGTSQWDSIVSYQKHARIMRDGDIYRSLLDSNQGNDPLSSLTEWEKQPKASDFSDGNFVPTSTIISGLDSITTQRMLFSKNGNVVCCSGLLQVTPTTANVSFSLNITLPIATVFSDVQNAAGVVTGPANKASGSISAVSGSNVIKLDGSSTTDFIQSIFYTFQYTIEGV